MSSSTNATEPRDALGAKILCWSLLAAGLIGAPGQFVLPDTIKSVTTALCVMLALVAMSWRVGTTGLTIRWSPFLLAPFALAVWAAVSTAWAPVTITLVEAGRWLLIGITMWLGLNAFGHRHFVHLARAAQLAVVLLSALALIEFWLEPGWFPAEAAPGSTFGNRNFFAEFVAVGLPFCLWRLLRQTRLQRAVVHGVATGIVFVALMATGSRAALIASILCAAMTLLFFVIGRVRGGFAERPGRGTLAAALLVPVAVVLTLGFLPTGNQYIRVEHHTEARGLTPIQRTTMRLGSLFNPENYAENSSFGKRGQVWAAGWKMVQENPLKGVGAGAWNFASPLYLPDDLESEHVWYAHNEPLQIVAEYGLVGWLALLALAGLVMRSMATAVRPVVERKPSDAAFQEWVAALAVCSFFVTSLAGLPLHISATAFFFAVSMGYLLSANTGTALTWVPGAVSVWIWRSVALSSLAAVLLLSVQGLRADFYVQRARSYIAALAANPQLPPTEAARIRQSAVADLRKGIEIYPDHGFSTIDVSDQLAKQSDHATVLWLSEHMLHTRPHVMGLKCNLIRANSELGRFKEARDQLESARSIRPNSPCLRLSEFVHLYRQGDFAGTVALGMQMMSALDSIKDAKEARYVVDTSYRAAIRVPDIDAAVTILKTRAERWPELRAGSWMLIGQLLASRAPSKLVPEAQDAFKRSIATTTNPRERQSLLNSVPELYRRDVQ